MKSIRLIVLIALVACTHAPVSGDSLRAQTATAACPTQACPVLKQVTVDGGIACSVNGVIGAPLYSAWDAEVLKAHRPEPADLTMLNRIKQFVHSKSLRYGYAGSAFMVFDANLGACGNSYYNLLNVPCNAYQPEENTIGGGGVDGCLHPPKVPWLHT